MATQTEPTLARVDKQRKEGHAMLTNKELDTIRATIHTLSAIKDYTIATESHDFYDVTGVSTKYIDSILKRLQIIKTKTIIAKKRQSEKANEWNKAHPERHNEINKLCDQRKRERRKEMIKDERASSR